MGVFGNTFGDSLGTFGNLSQIAPASEWDYEGVMTVGYYENLESYGYF